MAQLVRQVSKGAFLYSCNISHAYRQLPLDPVDWPPVRFKVGGRFFTDVSLPFGGRWALASCQDTTSLVTNHLRQKGLKPSTIMMTSRGGASKAEAPSHFTTVTVQSTLHWLGINKTKHTKIVVLVADWLSDTFWCYVTSFCVSQSPVIPFRLLSKSTQPDTISCSTHSCCFPIIL